MKHLSIIIAIVLLTGCASTNFRSGQSMEFLSTDQLIKQANHYAFLQKTVWGGPGKNDEIVAIQAELKQRHPDWDWENIEQGVIVGGMSKQETLFTAGAPCRRSFSSGRYGMREQWVYGCSINSTRYVYFNNDKVSGFGYTGY